MIYSFSKDMILTESDSSVFNNNAYSIKCTVSDQENIHSVIFCIIKRFERWQCLFTTSLFFNVCKVGLSVRAGLFASRWGGGLLHLAGGHTFKMALIGG